MTTHTKPVLIYFPFELLTQMDAAAEKLAVSRSELARRCIRRDLDFLIQHEVSLMARFDEEVQADHNAWIKRNPEPQQ